MSEPRLREWTLKELAAATGVAERTIRFYIAKGLVDPPLRAGRRAAYGEIHRAGIRAVRELQARGLSLAEIGHKMALGGTGGDIGQESGGRDQDPSAGKMVWFEPDGRIAGSGAAEIGEGRGPYGSRERGAAASVGTRLAGPEVWRTYEVAPDVRVMIKAGAAPWRAKALVAALGRFAAEVGAARGCEDKAWKA